MKKFFTFFILASMIISPNLAFAQNYLVTETNYYNHTGIDKGVLDTKVKDYISSSEWNHLKQSATNGKVILTDDMTLNDFYKANNLAPEDNYWTYMNVKDKNGNIIHSGDSANTTMVSMISEKLNLNASPWALYSPIFFSRLSVGPLTTINTTSSLTSTTNNYKFGNYTRRTYFPNLI